MEHNNGAPWQEVVVDKDVNFFELMPLFRFNRGDGGFFMYQEDRWAKSMSL
jgi:vanillate/4-hydroxybenzoate decarboxylase subunit C